MRFHKVNFLIALSITFSCIEAQWCVSPCSRIIAMSGADIAAGNEWTTLGNPAALAGYQHNTVGVGYADRFQVPELGTGLLFATIQIPEGVGLLALNYFGSESFNQSSFSLAYGHALSPWLDAGISMEYHHTSIAAVNQSASAISGDLSLIIRPVEQVDLTLILENPTRTKFNNDSGALLPGNLRFGISYFEIQKFYLSAQLGWIDFKRVSCSFGFEYRLFKFLNIRSGVQFPDVTTYSFGFGWTFERLNIDIGFEQHPWLGLSSAIGVSYEIR
jgi:hypothetical protein